MSDMEKNAAGLFGVAAMLFALMMFVGKSQDTQSHAVGLFLMSLGLASLAFKRLGPPKS